MGIKRANSKAVKPPIKSFVTLYMDVSTPEDPEAKEPLQFRQPHIPDLLKVHERMGAMRKQFPGAGDDLLFKLAFMCHCYVKEEDEKDVEIEESFLELATGNEFVFDDLLEQFGREYPLFFGWLAKQARALLPPSEISTTTP